MVVISIPASCCGYLVKTEEERNSVIFEDKLINNHINGKVSSRALQWYGFFIVLSTKTTKLRSFPVLPYLEPERVERRKWNPPPPCWARFSRKEYIGPIMAAPMAGVTIRYSLLFRALTLPKMGGSTLTRVFKSNLHSKNLCFYC